MVRLKHKLTQPAAAPARGVKAATFRLSLDTAMALIKVDGHVPSVAEVAARSKVSRATAYRYFPEPRRAGHGGGRCLARAGAPLRLERGRRPGPGAAAVRQDLSALHGVRAADARRGAARARAVGARARRPARRGAVPARPPVGILEHAAGAAGAALPAPVRIRLHRALSVVYGIEPYMILKDIWGLPDREVERIALWMADALIDAAQRDAAAAAARAQGAAGRTRRSRAATAAADDA
jgi:hypothetical protein